MRKGISVGVILAVAALAMTLTGATAAAGPRPGKATTHAGWKIVKQHGKRNYAGPNCPGVSWNCTTSTRVLQVATRGGINLANMACVTSTCSISQLGGAGASNVAKCTQSSTAAGAIQSCTIEQTGASNTATVTQTISQSTLATQSGKQTATVTQGTETARSTGFNVAKVTQSVNQSTKTTGGAQVQNALQKVVVSQWAGGSGYNQSTVYQSQIQKAYGGAPQSQNANAGSTADCLLGAPDAPNACSDVNQHSVSGTNYNALNQSIDQDANTAASGAFQQQGAANGGLEGHVHQDTVSGSSQNKAKQDKHQKANGPANGSQTQYDPVRCCGTASQFGGNGNVEDINQSSSIGASNPSANQHSNLIGESVTPNGKCNVNQHAAIDSASANNSETLTPCPYLVLTTSCTTGSVDIQAVSRGDNCTAFAPYFGVDSSLVKTVRNGDGSFADTADAATGDIVEFKIDYDNTGPADADNVILTDVVPAGLAYVEDSCSGPNDCSYDNGTITWNLGSVPGSETPSVTFLAEVVEDEVGATITNMANAATLEEGASATTDSATVTVVDEPPLSSLTKGVRPDGSTEPFASTAGVDQGDTVEYKITYSNSGIGDAHNLVVTDVLPASAAFVSGSCTPACSVSGSTITWNLGTAQPDNDIDLFFKAVLTVPCTGGDTVSNTAGGDTDEESSFSSNGTEVSVFLVC